MKRPPRQAKEKMVNCQLLSQVFTSALVIVAGTLYVFWREVRGKLSNYEWLHFLPSDGGRSHHTSRYDNDLHLLCSL